MCVAAALVLLQLLDPLMLGASETTSPSDMVMAGFDMVHTTTGMPWWMTIASVTFGVRTLLRPFGIAAVRPAYAFVPFCGCS